MLLFHVISETEKETISVINNKYIYSVTEQHQIYRVINVFNQKNPKSAYFIVKRFQCQVQSFPLFESLIIFNYYLVISLGRQIIFVQTRWNANFFLIIRMMMIENSETDSIKFKI